MGKQEQTEAEQQADARGQMVWFWLLVICVGGGFALGNSPQSGALLAVPAFVLWIIRDHLHIAHKRRRAARPAAKPAEGDGFDADLTPEDEHFARLVRQMQAARRKARG
jgi:hypothetical protein